MAHDIQLQYNEIDNATKIMTNAADTINPQLMHLKTQVDQLLANGLVLQQTSPAMQEAYQHFTIQLQQIVDKIKSFAKQFDDIKKQIEAMDHSMYSQMHK